MRKLIVVTGGTKGIGRAIIEKFVAAGFDACTCSRHEADLKSFKAEIESKYPGSALYSRQTDMAVKDQVRSFAAFVCDLGRSIDVLVNNAGYFVPGEISSEPDGNLESMIDANLYSAYHMTRGLLSKMKMVKSGAQIFNMCSIASFTAYKNGGSYAISKFALLGFSRCLREELKPFKIRVTAVMPGATKTRSWDGANLPDERFITVEDVADTVFSANALSGASVVEEIIIRPQFGDI